MTKRTALIEITIIYWQNHFLISGIYLNQSMNFRWAGLPTRTRKADFVELLTNEGINEFFHWARTNFTFLIQLYSKQFSFIGGFNMAILICWCLINRQSTVLLQNNWERQHWVSDATLKIVIGFLLRKNYSTSCRHHYNFVSLSHSQFYRKTHRYW